METAQAYRTVDPSVPPAVRLIDATGVEAGGSDRTEMPIQSAAIRI